MVPAPFLPLSLPPGAEMDLDTAKKLVDELRAQGFNVELKGFIHLPESLSDTPPSPPASARALPAPLVTLDQIAASVARAKRSLEHYRSKKHPRRMPEPTCKGGGGQPALWDWDMIRPWLEQTFHILLSADGPWKRRL